MTVNFGTENKIRKLKTNYELKKETEAVKQWSNTIVANVHCICYTEKVVVTTVHHTFQ